MTQEIKHTPWHTTQKDDCSGQTIVKDRRGDIICYMAKGKKDFAPLIASACNSHYELLEALEMVLEKAKKDQEPDYMQIETAIAKARGQQ